MRVEYRLSKLEQAMAPPPDQVNIIHLIIDPDAPGERMTEAVAIGADRSTRTIAREPGEPQAALLGRVERMMGWRYD